MNASLTPTWVVRDLPVLTAAARLFEEAHPGEIITVNEVAEGSGVSAVDTARACLALDPTYLVLSDRVIHSPEMTFVRRITDEGREAVGLWPPLGTVADRIVEALEALGNDGPDPDTRSRARRAVAALGTGTGSILTGVLTNVFTGTVT